MASEQDVSAPAAAPTRKRLNLKPRDPNAAARLEAERQAQLSSKNPFGAAKPREAVIAEKLGKTEEEVLKEEVSKEKLHLRLSGAQLEEKREAEGAVKEIEEALELEGDEGKRAELAAELANRQRALDDLMDKFAKATLETALSGGAPRVSQIRQQQQLQQEQGGVAGVGGAPAAYGQRAQGGGGGSFGGREFRDGGFGGRAGGGRQGSGRGFGNYQQRGGFADSYQQPDRQGSYGRRPGGGSRLPEWALDDAADAGFYDAPAATSAFIASGGYQGASGGPPASGSFSGGTFQSGGGGGGGFGGGGSGRGGRGGRGGGRGGGGNRYGNGGYDAGFGPGLGGEFEFTESDSTFGTGQDRF